MPTSEDRPQTQTADRQPCRHLIGAKAQHQGGKDHCQRHAAQSGHRKAQHGAVKTDLIGTRQAGCGEHAQRAGRPRREDQPTGGAQQAQHRAFGQHLADEAAAVRADRAEPD